MERKGQRCLGRNLYHRTSCAPIGQVLVLKRLRNIDGRGSQAGIRALSKRDGAIFRPRSEKNSERIAVKRI